MRTAVVVDTDIVSYIFKDDSRAELYRPLLEGRLLVISFMTVAELDRWALSRRWSERRRQDMEDHLSRYSVYPSDRWLCLKWADVMEESKSKGRGITVPDAWIAATALVEGIPLVTHNRNHYSYLDGISFLTPTL
jgi:predicted nucleic acid-binding protein